MSRCRILAILLLAMGILGAEAETFVKANVTTLLGPTFFVDDAATGGTDATVNQPASGTYVRSFAGLLKPNQGLTTVTITGLGFATASNAASNDATSLTASITYLGGDGAVGGGDDVPIGSVTAGYAYAANGEYACAFDAPLVAALNITALKFQVTFTPTNATGNGSVLFKVGTIPFDGTTGPKLSVAGTVSGALPAKVSRVNLSKYQAATASSVNNQYLADFATDGVVGNANSWRALTSTDPHWAEVTLPTLTTVRSAHLYLGVDDALVPGNFKVQYFSAGSGSWVDAPGSLVTGNTSTEVNIIFTSAVSAYRYRFYSDVDGSPRVKEFALFPPNPAPGTGVEQGYPIGTDVELNLAKKRPVVASAATAPGYARLAVDGYASSGSQWQTSAVGTTTLDIDLRVATKIGSAHLYSGDGAVAPLADFTLQYWTGSAWATIAGGAITGNTSAARVISFTTAPTTSQVRLTFQNTAVSVVRELCIFPANGGVGYPLGQDVLGMAPPAEEFEAYNTALYQVINRAANLPVVVSATEPVLDPGALAGEWSQYQLLLNVGTNTYRLRHRVTGKCLAGAGLSKTPGAALLDQNYSAMPYQNWRLIPVDGTDFYLMNEWSGLVVDTQAGATAAGTALVQQTMDGATTQHWRAARQTHYPKKGMAGGVDNASPFQASWAYNWGRTSGTSLPVDVVFHPMQWGNFNWDHGSTQGPLEQFISRWRREDKALHLLGFNEPDGAEQADLTTAQAIAMWPRLERMDVPLVSPVTINPDVAWMNDFMTQAQSRGYRIDVVAAHRYPDPNSGNSDALVNVLQSLYNTWDRPVWLTEFSVVDWNGNGTWTEEDNYNWLAEFLWRAESLPWLRQYSLFLFSGAETTNPWDPVGPRSNAYKSDGTTPTAFGELYFAWDGDATIRSDKAYFLHNKAERKRLQNAAGSSGPGELSIRNGGSAAQWVLRPTGTDGLWYITSLRDGRRLRYTGSALNFAAANTTGPAVQWSVLEDQHGWFYVENPAAPATARRLRDLGGAFGMVSSTSTGDNVKWRFIVPYAPMETSAPPPLTNLTATAGDTQVSLSWTPSSSSDLAFYNVYRSTVNSGPYTLIASNLTGASYTNTALQNGTRYYYVVTATDLTGFESELSTQFVVTPVIATPPTALVAARSGSTLTITWPASHLGWILETQANGLAADQWSAIRESTTATSYVMSLMPGAPRTFFRLRRP